MKKSMAIMVAALVGAALLLSGCSGSASSDLSGYVTISDASTHFDVVMDYSTGATPRQMGQALGQSIVKTFQSRPESYQQLLDSYLAENVPASAYLLIASRVAAIKPQLPSEYRDEIDGLGDTLCNASSSLRGDGKLSLAELYVLQLVLDVSKSSQCSAVSVYGGLSATGKTITGRVLDWEPGSQFQLPKLQAVTRIKKGSQSVILIGYLGYLSGLTVINDEKVFAAILESSTGEAPATLTDKRSYAFDLRYAMENSTNMNDVANFMKDAAHPYVCGHLIFLSDPDSSCVLENNLLHNRAVRTAGSALNAGVASWGFSEAVGSVNSFILNGNYDNHTTEAANVNRWASMITELTAKGASVTNAEVKEIMSYHTGASPGAQSAGDLYNIYTQQIIIVEPDTLALEVYFRPTSNPLPATPSFETISATF